MGRACVPLAPRWFAESVTVERIKTSVQMSALCRSRVWRGRAARGGRGAVRAVSSRPGRARGTPVAVVRRGGREWLSRGTPGVVVSRCLPLLAAVSRQPPRLPVADWLAARGGACAMSARCEARARAASFSAGRRGRRGVRRSSSLPPPRRYTAALPAARRLLAEERRPPTSERCR